MAKNKVNISNLQVAKKHALMHVLNNSINMGEIVAKIVLSQVNFYCSDIKVFMICILVGSSHKYQTPKLEKKNITN